MIGRLPRLSGVLFELRGRNIRPHRKPVASPFRLAFAFPSYSSRSTRVSRNINSCNATAVVNTICTNCILEKINNHTLAALARVFDVYKVIMQAVFVNSTFLDKRYYIIMTFFLYFISYLHYFIMLSS